MSARPEPEPDFHYDPFAREVMENPLPFYKMLRDSHPVYYMEKYDTFIVSRFQDILEVLSYTDNTFIGSESTLPGPERLSKHNHGVAPEAVLEPFPAHSSLGSPIYESVRQSYIKPLRPRSVAALSEFVEKLAHERLDELIPKGTFDLTLDYGGIISATVVCDMFGIPLERAAEVLNAVNNATRADPVKGGVDVYAIKSASSSFTVPQAAKRRAAGADGSVPVLDGLINLRIGERGLTDQEIGFQISGVLVGGTETAPKIHAHGLYELWKRPEQLAAVRADLDTNVPIAVEEFLRYCAPAQWFARTVHKPVTIAGQKMEPGQRVIVAYGSAARDEREFENPDDFIWNREIRRVLSFGFGQHHCVGLHLARLELRTYLKVFLSRVKSFHFDESRSVRYPSSFQWGWNSLTVVVDD